MIAATLERCDAADAARLAVLDEWLRPGVPWSLRDEYPTVFGPGSRAGAHVITAGGELLAHAATLDVTILVREAALRATLVGSVVVHPARRGEGLGRQLLAGLVETFQASESELLLLWSERRDFYAAAGLVEVGDELLVEVSPGPDTPRLRAIEPPDLDTVYALHAAKPVRVRRTRGDAARLLLVPELWTFVLERDASVVAYACIGKGLDFTGIVHECGGSDDAVATLLPALATRLGIPLPVLLPPWRAGLAARLGAARHGPLGLGLAKSKLPPDLYVEGLDSV
jgi:GNAT superfamily N-acetyltransferase